MTQENRPSNQKRKFFLTGTEDRAVQGQVDSIVARRAFSNLVRGGVSPEIVSKALTDAIGSVRNGEGIDFVGLVEEARQGSTYEITTSIPPAITAPDRDLPRLIFGGRAGQLLPSGSELPQDRRSR